MGDYPVAHTHKRYPPSGNIEDFYEFILVTSGEYLHKINGATRVLKEGSLCIMRPDDVHSTHEKAHDSTYITFCVLHEYFAVFPEMLSEGFIEKLQAPEFIELRVDPVKVNYFREILREYFSSAKNDYSDKTTCDKFLLAFTAEAVDALGNKPSDDNFSVGVATFLKLLSDPENLAKPLFELIEATNYSYSHLNIIFKKEVGVTPSEYLKEKRLSYAKRMLVATTYKHEAIAEKSDLPHIPVLRFLQRENGYDAFRLRRQKPRFLFLIESVFYQIDRTAVCTAFSTARILSETFFRKRSPHKKRKNYV